MITLPGYRAVVQRSASGASLRITYGRKDACQIATTSNLAVYWEVSCDAHYESFSTPRQPVGCEASAAPPYPPGPLAAAGGFVRKTLAIAEVVGASCATTSASC
jgi:hypothetical protein